MSLLLMNSNKKMSVFYPILNIFPPTFFLVQISAVQHDTLSPRENKPASNKETDGMPTSQPLHYNDVIMGPIASQITSLTIVLNRLFRRRSKKTSKLRVTGLCAGNSPGTGEFPTQMASYAENVSIWWRHHAWTVICWIKWLYSCIEWCSCCIMCSCYTVVTNDSAW